MHVLIIGSGIAGLGAALALNAPDKRITLFERDPAPAPSADLDALSWPRKGAPQLRHSHVFLARLYTLLRQSYPDLLNELIDAGARELKFRDTLPTRLRKTYVPEPGDNNLTILSCRRATLELVLRRFVERLPGVEICSSATVCGLEMQKNTNQPQSICGLKVKQDGAIKTVRGDIVIDASGAHSHAHTWLAKCGIQVPFEESETEILYFTRHYRLKDGMTEPRPQNWHAPSTGDLGYIKYVVFPADNGHFSITLATSESEKELRKQIKSSATFDRICASLPGTLPWTDPNRAVPTSRVFGIGNLSNRWRHWVVDGKPLILNFFAIGDATIRTNPLYGRGCSAGLIEAHILAGVLRKTNNPTTRAKLYDMRLNEELRPFYDSMVRQDRLTQRSKLSPTNTNSRAAQNLVQSFLAHGALPAARADLKVMRTMVRSLHMMQGPNAWLLGAHTTASMLRTWATPRPLKNKYYAGKLGPTRQDLLDIIAFNQNPTTN